MLLKTTATGVLPYCVLVDVPPGTQSKKAAFSAGLVEELALVEGASLNTNPTPCRSNARILRQQIFENRKIRWVLCAIWPRKPEAVQ